MDNTPKINRIRAKFFQKGIKIKNDWVEGCVDFFLNENPEMSDDNLYNEAFEQFLLADMTSAVCNPSLPDSVLQNAGIHQIRGKFTVQMQYLMDIAESPYDQWREIHNKVLDEVLEAPQETQPTQTNTKKKRVFKLELFDGKSTVTAMEYEPIECLHKNLKPGTKLMLSGELTVSKKVLLLKDEHVTVLGGEVDDILISNAYENILLKAMNRPINPNPNMNIGEATTQSTAIVPSLNPSILSANPSHLQDLRPSQLASLIPPTPNQALSNFSFNDDDDDLVFNQAIQSVQPAVSADDDSIFMELEQNVPAQTNQQDYDEFDEMVYRQHQPTHVVPQNIAFDSKEYKFKLEGCNLLTFDQLNEIPQANLNAVTFIFSVETREITEKLKVENETWQLGMRFGDRSVNKLVVKYCPKFLERLIGYSAKEIRNMKKRSKEIPSLFEEVMTILNNFNESLQDNSKLWKVSFTKNQVPLVVGQTELKPVYKRILTTKIETENLDYLRWRIE